MAEDAVISATKRRKIRKGTFSCWECKNRKTRCQLDPGTTSRCQFCKNRGLECVSQEFPNPADSDVVDSGASGVFRKRAFAPEDSEPAPRDTRNSRDPDAVRQSGPLIASNTRPVRSSSFMVISEPLSDHLRSNLPDVNTASLITSRGRFFSLPIHIRRQSFLKLTTSTQCVERFGRAAEPQMTSTHPLYFARKLIQLALCLQQLDSEATERLEKELRSTVHDVARRYVELASRSVTSQDSLVQSQDGLGTLMLEACYHINVGNLRTAWLLFRRALSIAQLLGLPQPGAPTGSCEETAWFRLLYGDRFMSLMLGMPCAIPEDNFAPENPMAEDPVFEKLERVHVAVLRRIIVRNVHIQRRQGKEHGDGYDDYKDTQDIDYIMKEVTRSLATAWWTPPTLSKENPDGENMARTAHLLGQMHHYCYLAILHLPYVVYSLEHFTAAVVATTQNMQSDYSYSQIAALAASREALPRFLHLRNFYQTVSYRSLDDKAYLAAIITILSHINGHRLGRWNVLDHQRPQDLKLVKGTIICIESASQTCKDSLSSSYCETLKLLMAIEEDCATGGSYEVTLQHSIPTQETADLRTDKERLDMIVPYFGILCIARAASTAQPASLGNDNIQPSRSTSLDRSINAQNHYMQFGFQEESSSPGQIGLSAVDTEPTFSTLFNIPFSSHNSPITEEGLLFLNETLTQDFWTLENEATSFVEDLATNGGHEHSFQ